MSYIENVTINFNENYQAEALANNLLIVESGTDTKAKATAGLSTDKEVWMKSISSSSSDVAYTRNSNLYSPADEIANAKNTIVSPTIKSIVENIAVDTVYHYKGLVDNLKDVIVDNAIWAVVVVDTTITAEEVVGQLPGYGMVLYPLTGDNTRPTLTKGEERIAFYHLQDLTQDLPALGIIASTALKSEPHRSWANRLLSFRPTPASATALGEYKSDRVNAFYVEGNNYYSGTGLAAKGYIDDRFAKDYVTYTIKNGLKKLLLETPKVTYDYRGIKRLETKLESSLRYLGDYGIIKQNLDGKYDFVVTIPEVDKQASEHRQARTIAGNITMSLAGTAERFDIAINVTEV